MPAKTILIIENDDASRAGLGLLLTQQGYVVSLAPCGRAGLEYLQKHGRPDLIFLDMLMPGMDGWQFLKQQDAAGFGNVPVLIATAIPISNYEWAVELGAKGYIRKPIGETALLEEVKRYLQAAG